MNKKIILVTSCLLFSFNLAMSAGLDTNLEPAEINNPSFSEFKRERRGSMVECDGAVEREELTQEPEEYPIIGLKPKKFVHFSELEPQELVTEPELQELVTEPEPKASVRRDSIDEYIKLDFNNKLLEKLNNDKLKKDTLSKLSDAEKEMLSGICNLDISNKGDYYIEYLAIKLLPTYKFSIKNKNNPSKFTPEEFKNVCKSHLYALMKKDKQDLVIDESQIDRIIFAAWDMHKVSINDAKYQRKSRSQS